MSGHSKWANIKHRKGKMDAMRGKIFTKVGREITLAAKNGADPTTNSKLADAIAKAKANNTPNDIIARAIKKGAGGQDDTNYEEIQYEGYGMGGVAVIVSALTDNRNRTGPEVRYKFDKFGGNLGAQGSVSFMFDRKGLIIVEKENGPDEEELMMLALDAGADDFNVEDDSFEILTSPENFSAVRLALEGAGIEMVDAEVTMIPQLYVNITDPEVAAKINRMIEALEDDDDVQNVYHNAELPDDEE